MAYTSMKKLIENQNKKLADGLISQSEYDAWKEQTMNKLDVFLSLNRMSDEQYAELVGMLR